MKNRRKWSTWTMLTVFLLMLLPGSLSASDRSLPGVPEAGVFPPERSDENRDSNQGEELIPAYMSFSGQIEEIWHDAEENLYGLYVRESEDRAAWLMVQEETFRHGPEPATGMQATGHYRTDIPMIMIYPPRYPVSVLLTGGQDLNVHVNLFDGDLVSADNTLQIMGEAHPVTLPDGTPYGGGLENRALVVFYGSSTRSIPAQTYPERVVVLPDDPEEGTPRTTDSLAIGTETVVRSIVVNGQHLQGPLPFERDGTLMIPLRAVLEARGHNVHWDPQTRQVDIDGIITLSPEKGYYRISGESLGLGADPELIGGITYVPVAFLPDVLGVQKLQAAHGQLIIGHP